MLRPLTVALLCMQALWVAGQNFEITRLERIGSNIVVSYNLIDTVAGRAYTINMYSSADEYSAPLQKVGGDVGLEVKPGANKKVTWDAKTELGADFAGDIALEVRGKVYIPFVKLDGFDDYRKFKRKKSYNITWTGGRGNTVLNFDLYHGDNKVASYPNIANVGHYTMKFDRVKAGRNYTLKISDSKNKDDVVVSKPFKIKAKVPLLVKVIPVVAVGYLAYVLTRPGEEEDPDIFDPPEP